jgi:N-methylhydantoinase B/oxoprolinase/acetone carboxylase alpha subunit
VFIELAWSRLIAAVQQEAHALLRTAFTTTVREAADLSAGVFDTQGRMIAQAITGTPGHINSMALGVEHIVKAFPPESLEPGDVLATNDPWLASGHLHDILVATPVFRRGRVIAFTASVCHAIDVGGRGLGTEAVDRYEEGILLPICRIYAASRPQQALDIFRENVRFPEAALGDLHAQVAGNAVGADRLNEMMDEFGLDDLENLGGAILDRSEAAMRGAIDAIPDGEYRYQLRLDGFDEPVVVNTRVVIDGSNLLVDYAGSSPMSKRGINVVLNYTRAYTTYGLKCVVAPDVPNNAGSFRPVTITAPEGSILNATRPAPVAARHVVGLFLPDAVMGALAHAVPDRVIAESSSGVWVVDIRGSDPNDRPFGYTFFVSGGMGARSDKDGLSATQFPSTVRNTSAEVIESKSPLIIYKRALAQGTGGAGRYRGGLGVSLELGVRTNRDYLFSPSFERLSIPPAGRFGGGDGAPGRLETGGGRRLDPKAKHWLAPSDRLRIDTPGGGGVGDPKLRDAELVERDRIAGHESGTEK